MFDAAAAATASEVASEQVAQEQAEAAVSSAAGADGQTGEQADSQGVLDAIATYNPGESRSEVVFVDPTVPNYRELLSGMDPNIEVIVLDAGQDGVEQMASALAGRSGIDAIHIISHGSVGQLQLGTGTLNAESMSGEYAEELATIQQALSEQADILVYGCDFAEGEAGQVAVNLLADLTGADVQASTDETGHISLGGDWEFEVQTGSIETSLAVGYDAQMSWAGLLGTETVKDTFSSTSYSNNNGTQSWATSWSETDAGGSGASGGDIRVNSSQLRIDTISVGDAISRGVNLSGASSATLSFDYTNSMSSGSSVSVRISTDGGASYQTLSSGIFSNSSHTGSGTASFDISSYMSANTKVQFIVTGISGSGGDRLFVDNVQISYNVNSAPTITNLSGDSLAYSEGAGAVVIEQGANALVADVDSTNLDTGTLTVSIPSGGDSAEDVLSIRNQGTGAGQIGVSGSTVTYGGTTIGTFTGGSSGSNLVITLNSNATPTAVTALVKNITYQNTDTNAPTTGARTVRYVLTDGDGGTSANYDTTVTVSAVNDAPVLADTALTLTVAEDAGAPSGAVGSLVSAFTGGITDVDSGAAKGLAITGSNETTGTWYYTTNGGSTWTAVGTVSNTSALLLADNGSTRLYFAPNADYNGTSSAALTVRAWDQTSGTAGTKVSTATNGGTTAFSSATDTVDVTVTPVDDAPVAADDRAGLTFDGLDDYVDMGSGAVYEVTNTVTMEAWINREPSSQSTQIIINKEGEYEVALDADGSLKWAFANTNPGWTWHDTGVVIPVHTWTHIAVTYDNGTITSYVNGVAVETFAGSGTIGDAHPTKDSLRIGGRENNPANQYFNGQISEAQVWNVARTAGEIASDLNGTLTGSETGLLGYWKFNENTGTTADNLTANSDGTLGGGVSGQTPQWATYRVNEDATLTVSGSGVLGNDYDADGDTLSAIMVTGPSHASAFTLNPDGSFSYTPAANFSGTDSFTYRVSDGTNLSNVATVYIQVDPVNDAPTITNLSGDSLAYNEGDGAVVIEQGANALVADVDSTNLDTGTLTVSIPSGGDSAEDVLSIRNQGTGAGQIGVSGSNVTYGGTTIGTFTGGSSGSNLVITLTSNATPTAVTALVKNITYQNTDTNAPTTGARTVRYVLTDGDGGTSANYDTTVTVSAVNDAPVLADTALSLTVAEDAGAPSGAVGSLVSAFTGGITDVDSGAAKGLAITGSNETTGTWYYTTNGGSTWTAVGTVSNTSALLLADNGSTRLYFAPNADYNGTSSAALTVRAWDQTSGTAGTKVSTASNGGTTAFSSATDTVDVSVTAVNDAPVVDLNAGGAGQDVTTAFTEQTPVLIAPVGTLSDVDSATLSSLTVTLTARPDGNAVESLSLNSAATTAASGAGLTVSYTASTGVLSITGAASTATYQTILQGIQYTDTSDTPTTSNRSITVVANDGTTAGTTRTVTVTVSAVNDAPTITNLSGDSLAYNEGDGAVVIEQGANVLVADVDSTNLDTGTLTVSIPSGGDSAEDVLSIRNQGTGAGQIGVSGSTVTYGGTTIGTFTGGSSGSNLVITLNSNATPTAVTALVKNITYQNTDTNAPTTGARTVRYVLTDGDGGTSANYDTTVTVSAVNDAPVLADTALTLTVAEDAGAPSGAVGSLVSAFTGGITDVDSGAAKGLAITGSNETTGTWYYTTNGGSTWTAVGTVSNTSALLLADNGSTRLYFAPGADYNGTSSAALTVRAWDQTSGTAGTKVSTATNGGTTAFSSATDTVNVTVSAVNDAPADLSLSANSVAENAANGTVVGTVSGTDPDSGDTKSYSFTDSAGGRFAINSSTGQITVADGSLLNYESATSHNVTVRVTDSGGLTYDETFTINLTNVNEAPTDLSLSSNTVAENAANGTVVGTITGTDPDSGDTKSYSFTNSAGGRFAINSSTGQITVADGSLLNYEAATNHSVTVRVTDSGGLTYDETFTINLTNVNETPTDMSLSANTVGENAANGTVVGTVSGTDPDSGDTKSYSFTDSAGGRFAINSSMGQITVADGSLLNYESATSHTVTVRVTDSGGLTYDETFTINLTNVNEAPTGADATVTISEDTSHALTTANFGFSDVDAGDTMSAVRIDSLPTAGSLTLSGVAVTAGQVVSVANITAGNLVFTPAANANGPGYANFTFSVRDSNNTYDAAPNTVTFTVTAVDDATVVTGGTSGTGTEDTPLTGTLTATDVEGLSDGTVFSVSTNAAHGTASIDPGTGLWSYTPTADWHGTDSFTVTITDDAGNASTQVVSVTVTPVNDAPTELALSSNTVAENATTGTVVGTITGTDPDAGDTKTYSLTDTAGGRFAIDPTTGQLTVADGSLLNYESATSHSVTVRVTDAGGLTYDQTFTINLTNVNEGPTDLSLSVISIAENAATGTVVGTVSSTDPDAGDTKTYSLTDTAGGRFAIDPTTGQLTVADGSLLNYEAATSHTVTVRVTDAGGLTYDQTFTINLTNVNEGPTGVQKGNGGGPPFLYSNRPVAFEGSARPAFLSQMKEDPSEGEGRVPDDMRKPVEWSTQPAPLLDALRPDRNLAGRARDGDGTNTIGSKQDRASSTSPRTQDETAVNLDAANAARPELEQVPWPPTAETENVPDDSGGLGVPMAVGLVGAVLQGQLGKKERMTTLTGQNQTRDRQPEKEQNSEQPGADDQVVPPNQH